MTVNVTGTVSLPNGEPYVSSTIVVTRSGNVVSLGGSVLLPDSFTIETDGSGAVDFDVEPGSYTARANSNVGRITWPFTITDTPSSQDWSDAVEAADPSITPELLLLAQQAAAEAEGFADAAEASAGNAADSAAEAEAFALAAEDSSNYDYLVDEEADLATVSPSPSSGDRAYVRDTEDVWMYDGADWNNMGPAPTATKADRTELAAETARATAAELALGVEIDGVVTALDNEVIRATASEDALAASIDAETDRAVEVETAIIGDLTEMVATPLAIPAFAGVTVSTFTDKENGAVPAFFDKDGFLHAELKTGIMQFPASPMDYIPKAGFYFEDAEFLGFDVKGELIGSINRALSFAGIAPDPVGYGLRWDILVTGKSDEPTYAFRREGGLVDFGRARAPVIGTEWLDAGGTQVAPLTAGAYECVVAYFHDGERRVLTSQTEELHYRAPELAYGGVSVRCWRSDGKIMAVSIAQPGFMVPDDPDLVWAITGDGQSLSVGSFGGPTPFPYKSVPWPDHTLTVDNSIKPGDIRTGRDASNLSFRIDPDDLTGLTAIKPQTGINAGHGLTPLEAMVVQLQDDIVELIGRPQRMVAWTGGVGGASITDIGLGTDNEANQKDVMDAAYAFCVERGWRLEFVANLWTHGQTDAVMDTVDYVSGVNDYRDELDSHITALTGQANRPAWIMLQPSSFIESGDDEISTGSIPGMVEMMLADPDDTVVAGPDYPDYTGFVSDYLHMSNDGYLRLGESSASLLRHLLWGGEVDRPLYVTAAEISGATITLTWSEDIEEADDVPAITNLGVEVSNGANSFLTITSHTITGDAESTIVLSASVDPGDVPDLLVQIGLSGQDFPRTEAKIPRTNIRTVRTAYRNSASGVLRHRHALHQRIAVTL